MKIQIEDKLFLESDENQFIIRKYLGTYNKETGKENSTPLGFYGSASQALRNLLKKKILQSDATTFKELIKEVEETERRINEVIRF